MTHNDTMNDTRLVQQTLAGQREAFDILVKRHFAMVYAVTFAWTRSHADAEDAAQETFIKAYTALDSLRDANRFSAWLVTIARRICHGLARKSQRQRALEEQAQDAPPVVLTDVEQRESAELVRRQLERLKSRDREILMLRYYANHSVREIAALLSISNSATAKRLQRAREALGEQLLHSLASPEEEKKHSSKITKISSALALTQAPWATSTAHAAAATGIFSALGVKTLVAASVILLGLAGGGIYLVTQNPVTAPEAAAAQQTATTVLDTLTDIEEPAKNATQLLATSTASNLSTPTTPLPLTTSHATESIPFTGVLSGKVTDTEGIPIPNVEVDLFVIHTDNTDLYRVTSSGTPAGLDQEITNNTYSILPDFDTPIAYDRANRQGRFTLSKLPRTDKAWIRFRTEGFCSTLQSMTLTESNEELNVSLEPGIVIRGRMITPKKVSPAEVRISLAAMAWADPGGASGSSSNNHNWDIAFIDAQGHFSLTVPQHGVLGLKADTAALGVAYFNEIDTQSEVPIRLEWPTLTTVYGKITWPDGTPAANCRLLFEHYYQQVLSMVTEEGIRYGGGGGFGGGNTRATTTDETGGYQIEGITPGQQFMLSITDRQGAAVAREVEVGAIPATKKHLWNYVLETPCLLQGTLTDVATERPLAGIEIHFRKPVENRFFSKDYAVVTDENGDFSVNLIEGAGTYIISPRYTRDTSNHSPAPENAYRHQTTIKSRQKNQKISLELPAPHSRSFLVVDQEGHPVPGCSITVSEFMESNEAGWRWPELTDAEGRITLSGLAPEIDIQCRFIHGDSAGVSQRYYAEAGEIFPEETVVLLPLQRDIHIQGAAQ